MATGSRWGRDFDPEELARLETLMWKAYYRRQPARLFVLLVRALRAQAQVSWLRALRASLLLTRAAAGFARSTGEYERFAADIGRGYRMLGLPEQVDVEAAPSTSCAGGSSDGNSGWLPARGSFGSLSTRSGAATDQCQNATS